jgi:hypothetical protein
MRDIERTPEKPADTYRIAVLGPSHVMGSGVADGETITRLLEQELNESAELRGMRYEVLNFGVAGYALTHYLAMLQDRVFSFQPDAVFIIDSPTRVPERVVGHLNSVTVARREIPFPALAEAVAEADVDALGREGVAVPFAGARAILEKFGVRTRMPWHEGEQRLRRHGDRLVKVAFEQIAMLARQHRAVPVFVGLDNVDDSPRARTLSSFDEAREAGLLVFDLLDLWSNRDMKSLRISEWDKHPNVDANRLTAERLRDLIREHGEELRLGGGSGISRDRK